MEPDISVIMPVYNVDKYIVTAIQSILCQTFENFGLIIIDDASQDRTNDLIKQFHDSRIINFQNGINMGIANTLNKGINIARGKFIARMDGDDISKPNRLEKQLDFIKSNPNLIICGTHMDLINKDGNFIKMQKKQIGTENVRLALFFGHTSMAHPSIIIKKEMLNAFCLRYDSAFYYAEDYDLYCRATQYSLMNNLDESLIQYRIHDESVSKKHFFQQQTDAKAALYLHLKRLKVPFTLEQLRIHSKIAFDDKTFAPSIDEIKLWFNHLRKWNRTNNYFKRELFEEYCTYYQDTMIQKRGI